MGRREGASLKIRAKPTVPAIELISPAIILPISPKGRPVGEGGQYFPSIRIAIA